MPDPYDRALCEVLAHENFPCIALRDGASWLVPCVLELDEGEATISPIANLPKESWIEMYIDNSGWDFFSDDEFNEWNSDDLGWCMRRGISPGQRFYSLVSVEASRYGVYNEDYDESWDAELVWAEHVSQSDHARRIEEMLQGWWIQDQIHAEHKWAWECRVARAPEYVSVTPTRRQGVAVSRMTTADPPCTCCRLATALEVHNGDSMNDVPDIIRENYWDDLPLLVASSHANVLALGRLLCPGGGRDEIRRLGKTIENTGILYSPLSELECELKFANSVRRLDAY